MWRLRSSSHDPSRNSPTKVTPETTNGGVPVTTLRKLTEVMLTLIKPSVPGTKEWQRSFQPSMKARILALRSVDGAEGAAVGGLSFDEGEPDLDEVEPRARRRSEVHADSGLAASQSRISTGFVGGAVVQHQVQLNRLTLVVDLLG
jgi:hypothetical protein